MEPLTIQIKHPDAIKALQSLEKKQFIKIVKDAGVGSPALPGEPLSLKAFQNWLTNAEEDVAFDLKEAEKIWISKRKKLQKLSP